MSPHLEQVLSAVLAPIPTDVILGTLAGVSIGVVFIGGVLTWRAIVCVAGGVNELRSYFSNDPFHDVATDDLAQPMQSEEAVLSVLGSRDHSMFDEAVNGDWGDMSEFDSDAFIYNESDLTDEDVNVFMGLNEDGSEIQDEDEELCFDSAEDEFYAVNPMSQIMDFEEYSESYPNA